MKFKINLILFSHIQKIQFKKFLFFSKLNYFYEMIFPFILLLIYKLNELFFTFNNNS